MDVLKALFFLLLVTFPIVELGRFQFSNGLAFTLNLILVILVVGAWFVKRKTLKGSLTKPLCIFAGIGVLSLLVNMATVTSFQLQSGFLYLLRWVLYALIYFVVADFDAKFRKTIKRLMVFAGTVIVLAGYIQYFLYPGLKSLVYAGWDEHLYRMFSTFLDPNFLGAFLVLFFIFRLGVLIQKYSFANGGLVALSLGAIFLTFSRSAILMLLVSSITLFIMMGKKRFFFLLIAILLFAFFLSSKYFYISNINPFRIIPTQARLETTGNAIAVFTDNPILGVGFNLYRFAQIRYGFRNVNGGLVSHADASPDSSVLFVLATTGLVGLCVYGYLWFSILRNAYRQKSLLSIVIISSAFGLFAGSLFINSLFYPFIMLWMWTLLGLNEEVKEYK